MSSINNVVDLPSFTSFKDVHNFLESEFYSGSDEIKKKLENLDFSGFEDMFRSSLSTKSCEPEPQFEYSKEYLESRKHLSHNTQMVSLFIFELRKIQQTRKLSFHERMELFKSIQTQYELSHGVTLEPPSSTSSNDMKNTTDMCSELSLECVESKNEPVDV